MPVRRSAVIGIAAGLVVIAAGTVGLLSRHSTPAPPPPPAGVATVPAPTGSVVADSASASPAPSPSGPAPGVLRSSYAEPQVQGGQAQVALPVSLTIPVIGVRAPLITLGLASDGTLYTTPLDSAPQAAGWYTGSVRPGAVGPAVIAGHINYGGAEGVFWRLNELRPGDIVYVGRADGSTIKFRVTAVQSTLKTDFPTGGVYGATADAELRLITCGGTFDPATKHYLSNTIVYTTEAS